MSKFESLRNSTLLNLIIYFGVLIFISNVLLVEYFDIYLFSVNNYYLGYFFLAVLIAGFVLLKNKGIKYTFLLVLCIYGLSWVFPFGLPNYRHKYFNPRSKIYSNDHFVVSCRSVGWFSFSDVYYLDAKHFLYSKVLDSKRRLNEVDQFNSGILKIKETGEDISIQFKSGEEMILIK